VHPIEETRTAPPAPPWVEHGLALGLTLCFLIALVLKLNETGDESRSLQFALLAVAVVFALALVAVRRRAAASAVSADDAGDAHMSR
jgi:hypothetical protein